MTVKGSERPPEKTCNTEGCNAWATKESDRTRCDNCGGKSTGPKTEEGKKQSRMNATKHGLYQSKETFLEHAKEHHRDAYHAIHESLCADYERKHNRLPVHIEKRLADIALDMVRIDMGDEYEAENAVDPEKPLTEKERKMSEAGPWEKEVTSKIEQIKTNISRETRLALKDMGIYNSPEKQQADAAGTLAEILSDRD